MPSFEIIKFLLEGESPTLKTQGLLSKIRFVENYYSSDKASMPSFSFTEYILPELFGKTNN